MLAGIEALRAAQEKSYDVELAILIHFLSTFGIGLFCVPVYACKVWVEERKVAAREAREIDLTVQGDNDVDQQEQLPITKVQEEEHQD